MKILLVEDDFIAALAAKSLLTEQLGCTVDVAKNGLDAVELAQENVYTLILMDIGLPDISGFEAASHIKAKNRKAFIVALTGHTNDEAKSKAQQAGMKAILSKPLKIHALKSIMTRLVEKNKRPAI